MRIQNRRDENGNIKNVVQFKGKNWYYTNVTDLARQLNIDNNTANKLINGPDTRVITNKKFDVDKINIKNPDRAILKREYGITNIGNKELINGIDRKNGTVSAEKFDNDYLVNSMVINVDVYVSFYNFDVKQLLKNTGKDLLATNNILDNEFIKKYVDQTKLNDFIKYGDIQLRNVSTLVKSSNNLQPTIEDISESSLNEARKIYGDNVLFIIEHPIGRFSQKTMEYKDGYVSHQNVFQLDEWANIEYNNIADEKDTCAVKFFADRYPNLYWELKKIETENGIKLSDCMNFCDSYLIPYQWYHISGKLLHEKKYDNTKKSGIVYGIIYNGHLHPTSGGKPLKRIPKEINKKLVINGCEKLECFLNKNILPSSIKVADINKNSHPGSNLELFLNIKSFIVKNTKYICNMEYTKCKNILEKMGYPEYMKDDTIINNIPRILEKILVKKPAISFFPEKDTYRTNALTYKCKLKKEIETDINHRNISAIDKNKAYSWALYELPYLITFDYRTNNINNEPIDIQDHNLYWCVPKYYSADMPNSSFNPGYDVKRYQKIGIEFTIKTELVCDVIPNYYRQIIDIMLKNMDEKDFKTSMVILIGCFEKKIGMKYSYKFNGIFNNDSKMNSGYYTNIGDHKACYECKPKYDGIRDNFAIAVQIKNKVRNELCDTIKSLELKDEDIIGINTDCIIYKGELPKKLDSKNFFGWKKISVDINKIPEFKNLDDDRSEFRYDKMVYNNGKSRILHDQYAGAGKTTFIIKKLVPELIRRGISYIVLTPSHETLHDYKKSKINCEIFQHFVFVNKYVPVEEYIIIDEIGFLDSKCHDVLYKFMISGKHLECFGDFKQLLSVDGKSYNQKHYLNYMFNKIDTSYTNYRNNFTIDYYDRLRHGQKEYNIEKVHEWSSEYNEAELIISYRKKTKKIYNELMLKKLGKKPYDIDTQIICNKNNLMKKYGIYNHQRFTIIHEYFVYNKIIVGKGEHKKVKIILTLISKLQDEYGNTYKIPKKIVKKNFEHSYCMNIHQVQGRTLNSYHWCEEDNFWLTEGRVAYTVVSRLKQKIDNMPKEKKIKFCYLDDIKYINNNSTKEELTKEDLRQYDWIK